MIICLGSSRMVRPTKGSIIGARLKIIEKSRNKNRTARTPNNGSQVKLCEISNMKNNNVSLTQINTASLFFLI